MLRSDHRIIAELDRECGAAVAAYHAELQRTGMPGSNGTAERVMRAYNALRDALGQYDTSEPATT